MLRSAPHRKVASLHDELGDNRDVLSRFSTDLRGYRQRPYLHVPPGPPSGPLRRDEEVAFTRAGGLPGWRTTAAAAGPGGRVWHPIDPLRATTRRIGGQSQTTTRH
jgi:hypothetical protein